MTGDDLRGRRLGGFELLEPLGEGSFGTVWRARQLRLDRDVAVKVLDPLVARDPNAARRFEREGRSAASLDHPSIVPVYEAGDDAGLYYLAMRLVDGETLADAIEREAPMPTERVAELLGPIAAALDTAHAAGLIHRDVKPANILIEDGRPFLSDFGIAASARELGRYTTGSIGTAEYMAPEQARGDSVDHRSDLYSLGCVAYHALTGKSPFARDDIVSTLLAHSVDEAPSTADGRLDAFFARALAKDPSERFHSGTELISAFEGGDSEPLDRGVGDRPHEQSRRRLALVAATVIALALVVGTIVSISQSDGGEEDRGQPDATVSADSSLVPTSEIGTVADPDTIEPDTSEPDTSATDTGAPGTSGPVAGENVGASATATALRAGGSVAVGTRLRLTDPNPHANLDVAKLLAEWVLPVMYRIDEHLDAVPSLALGPPTAATDDPLLLTWSIDDGRVWEDGTPVTTEDVVATYEYLTAPDTNAANTILYDKIESVEAIDATTLQLRLVAPTGAAHLLFSTIHPIIKASAWRDHLDGGATAATFLTDGVDFAAGPYQLASRQNVGEIALGRNAAWNQDIGPALDRVSFASYPDSAALVDAQALRQVDLIWVNDVERSEIHDALELPDTAVVVDNSDVAVQLSLNLRSPPLSDPLVRRAILNAIDRDLIADTAVGRKTDSVADPWNSLMFAPGQRGDESPFADAYDVDEANRLLDEAGWERPDSSVFRRKDGVDLALTVVLNADSDSVNTALAIEGALQSIGIDVTGTPGSSALTNERMRTGAFDLLLQFRIFNNDPVATELSFATTACPATIPGCSGDGINFGAFADPDVDAAFMEADRTTDPDERLAVYQGVDEHLLELVPAIPLYVEPAFTAYRNEISGIMMAPNVGPVVSLADWGFLASS